MTNSPLTQRAPEDAFQGLTSQEAQKRLDAQGPNQLQKKGRVHPLAILLSQFSDFLTIILLMSTGLSFLLGERTEAITILAIVIINALLGFFQEYRTEKTIDALRSMAAPHSTVLRDGKPVTVLSSEIVSGDVVLVEAGDRVPADATVLSGYGLTVDESLLTGESVPVEKNPRGKEAEGRVFMGTVVTQGRARALVTATGMRTEMGKIAGMLNEIDEPETPLQKRLDQLGKVIAIGCLAICAVVSLTGILRGENVMDMIMTGISLSVAAVPEGLAAIVTISLALAVGRMVKRKALIRKLHAVETLGCSSVICTDKTGTLTENKMTVRAIRTLEREIGVTGSGHEPKGTFTENGRSIDPKADTALSMALTAACLCNNAVLPGEGAAIGDPTEIALLIAGQKAGIMDREAFRRYRRMDEIPFDSDRKCMSVLASPGGRGMDNNVFVKGAPDVLLEKCSRVATGKGVVRMTQSDKAQILRENERLAAGALRVLAVAYKDAPGADSKADREKDLTFLALFGMIDPPREASLPAVKVCKKAGIRPVMITGDHMVTAKAIARDLEIYRDGDGALTGQDLDGMDDAALAQAVQGTTVYARVSPRHKLRIVRALRDKGEVVAMTGDGVNDAPAIKEADIGVSMGESGTDVAKEAAGVILLDDNFATLVAAVEEGRIIYKNIRKFIRYLLSCNVGEVLTMFVGMLLGFPVVLLPIQILWINLVTDGLPAIALGMDPPDGDEMLDPPRPSGDSIFAGGLLSRIAIRGSVIAFCTLMVFMLLLRQGRGLEMARTSAFLTLVLTQLIHVFECKSERRSLFRIPLLNNRKLIGAALLSLLMILAVIYIPPLMPVFHTVALPADALLLSVGLSVIGPLAAGFLNRNATRQARPKRGVAAVTNRK